MQLHILGICGTFMGGVARLAKELGHTVSGTDTNPYPPMSTQLEALNVQLFEGYSPDNIPEHTDIVVVGNTISRGNPELEAVLSKRMRYTSGAQWLSENVLHNRWVLAVAGTHGKTTTFPRVADVIGFCRREQAVQVSEEIVKIQRDFGNRSDRRNARLKYTIEAHGVDWFKNELHERLGWQLEATRDFSFESTTDRYGWSEDADGKWAYGLFVEGGRLRDAGQALEKTAMREIAAEIPCEFRLTANQNLVIARVSV
ncbi:MAG: hypothetical protein HOM55_03610, partial [Proteobacteria bacterium]|nr:hypothetical protein [Pseudomonadota bacterium]